MTYATNTKVSEDATLRHIEKVLDQYGATEYGFLKASTPCPMVEVVFVMTGHRIRFRCPLPEPDDVNKTATGRERSQKQAELHLKQARKSAMRSLYLTIKAKLESVDRGIECFEEAFLAQIIMPDHQTVWEHMRPSLPAPSQPILEAPL